jgi:hypothetical protein
MQDGGFPSCLRLVNANPASIICVPRRSEEIDQRSHAVVGFFDCSHSVSKTKLMRLQGMLKQGEMLI